MQDSHRKVEDGLPKARKTTSSHAIALFEELYAKLREEENSKARKPIIDRIGKKIEFIIDNPLSTL